jgi:hypothetical protein
MTNIDATDHFLFLLFSCGIVLLPCLKWLRLQTGSLLFLFSLISATLLCNLETAASLMDDAIIQIQCLKLILVFILCHWIHELEHENMPCKNTKKEIDPLVHYWFKSGLTFLSPFRPYLSILIFVFQKNLLEISSAFWPLPVLWILAGLLCFKKSLPPSTFYSRSFFIKGILYIFTFFLYAFSGFVPYVLFLFLYCVFLLIKMNNIPECLGKLHRKTNYLDWMMLAAGCVSWLWILEQLAGHVSDIDLAAVFVNRIESHSLSFLFFSFSSFLSALIGGDFILTLAYLFPFFLKTGTSTDILSCLAFLILGLTISPWNIGKFDPEKKSFGFLKKLILPCLLVAGGLKIILIY